ncbi:MAG: helix-turn-helix domain-containing protein [Thermoleophilaceae bacterium]|nr:helix-turn-helix domain-containing protein [Thermoleophilaceae bacterium]
MGEIGETLRERRMALKIDVHEVEEATKIRAKYLRALENEEYDLLPGSAYVKSFLRTYAEYLEIDPRPLVDEYRTLDHHADEDPMVYTPTTVNRRGSYRLWLVALLLIVIVVVVLFLVGLLGGTN